jgi:hypothetical protein
MESHVIQIISRPSQLSATDIRPVRKERTTGIYVLLLLRLFSADMKNKRLCPEMTFADIHKQRDTLLDVLAFTACVPFVR